MPVTQGLEPLPLGIAHRMIGDDKATHSCTQVECLDWLPDCSPKKTPSITVWGRLHNGRTSTPPMPTPSGVARVGLKIIWGCRPWQVIIPSLPPTPPRGRQCFSIPPGGTERQGERGSLCQVHPTPALSAPYCLSLDVCDGVWICSKVSMG